MARDLKGKPILITGASSGIGRATALACAKAGMPVALAARRADRLREAVGEIERAGGTAIAVECDVADETQCAAAVEACVARFGGIHAVFANAGYGEDRPVHESSDADVRRMFEVNFFGTLSIVRAALVPMQRAGRGHLLICSSCLARMPVPRHGVYCATKAAQHHVARAMRIELAPSGIDVTSVHPIGTRTEFFDVARRPGAMKPMVDPRSPFMQDAGFVADRIVRCLRRERPESEVWPGVSAVLLRAAMAGLTAWPVLGDFVMRRAARRDGGGRADN